MFILAKIKFGRNSENIPVDPDRSNSKKLRLITFSTHHDIKPCKFQTTFERTFRKVDHRPKHLDSGLFYINFEGGIPI